MNKVVQRLLIFFIGVPLVLSLIMFDFLNHSILHIAIIIVTIISTIELYKIVSKKLKVQPLWFLLILCISLPVSSAICIVFSLPMIILLIIAFIDLLFIMTFEIFTVDIENPFQNSIAKIASSFCIFIYCGVLISFVSLMTSLQNATSTIILFLLIVFLCDSLAWLFGVLFGKNNRGFVKASPNKSIAGFIGGIFGSILAAFIMFLFCPPFKEISIKRMIVIAVLTAIYAILGDLVESVFKRSSQCKDSGFIIPGRGGILDSIDSILFSAPIFFLLVKLILGF